MNLLKELEKRNNMMNFDEGIEKEESLETNNNEHPCLSLTTVERCIFANIIVDIFEFSSSLEVMNEIRKIINIDIFDYEVNYDYQQDISVIKSKGIEEMAIVEGLLLLDKYKKKVCKINSLNVDKEVLTTLKGFSKSIINKDTINLIKNFKKIELFSIDDIKYYFALCHISIENNIITCQNFSENLDKQVDFNFDDNRSIKNVDIYSTKGNKRIMIEFKDASNTRFIVTSYDYDNMKAELVVDRNGDINKSKCYNAYESLMDEAEQFVKSYIISPNWRYYKDNTNTV